MDWIRGRPPCPVCLSSRGTERIAKAKNLKLCITAGGLGGLGGLRRALFKERTNKGRRSVVARTAS